MTIQAAINLIEQGVDTGSQAPQQWADLGAGEGLFTRALSKLLPAKSTIYAVDKNEKSLSTLVVTEAQIALKKITQDFTTVLRELPAPDGIIMANALHFVSQQEQFLQELRAKLRPSGRAIFVEYDMHTANPWVPYPISIEKLKKMATATGFSRLIKLADMPSVYNQADIYAALLIK